MAYPPEKLPGRYRSMAILEVLNALVVLPLLLGAFGMPATVANLGGALAVAVTLLVGGAYWWAKLRQLRSGAELPEGMGFFAAARLPCWVLVVGALVLAVGAGLAGPTLPPGFGGDRLTGWLPGAGLAAFGVLEQINYFHVQLGHDNRYDLQRLFRSGLRRSKLARDLDAWAARPR